MKKTVKSGKIEFYRFVFCLSVLGFHMVKYFRGEPSLDGNPRFEFFPHGSISVEFFFLISGFFMARSIYKKVAAEEQGVPKSDQSNAAEYLNFMKNKYLRILPEHIPMFLMTFVIYVVLHHMKPVKILIQIMRNIPSFFLIQMSGINLGNVLHIEWYISSMLFAMALLYPVCRKYYYTFTRYFGPLLALLILGYIQETTGFLSGVSVWMGICYKSTLRAIAEVTLGATCFELSRYLGDISEKKDKSWKIFWTLAEAGCFAGSMMFIMMTMEKKYEIVVLILFFVMITVAMSGASYGAQLFDKKVFYFLGRMILPVYLAQLAAIYIVQEKMKNMDFNIQVVCCIGLIVVFVSFTEILSKPIAKQIEKIK